MYPSGRHDDLNVICEVFGEILGGQGRTGTQEDKGFTDRFQLGEYLFQFRGTLRIWRCGEPRTKMN